MLQQAYKLRSSIDSFITSWKDTDISLLKLALHEWKHIEYLLELLYDFWLYTNCVSKHKGVTIHKAYDIYDSLFNHLEDAMAKLGDKQHLWKRKLYFALQAAFEKLQHYYNRTYGFDGVIYAIATILNPCQKLSAFKGSSWMESDKNWVQEYRTIFRKVFAYYNTKYGDSIPEINGQCQAPLSSIDKALYCLKYRRVSSSQLPNESDDNFAKIKKYLHECKSSIILL
jgi:hypothetical protein